MSTYLYTDGVARLGRPYSGLGSALGYRLVDSTGAVVQPWTNAGVTETGVPGDYEVILGGIRGLPVPLNFTGKVVWGTYDGVSVYGDLSEERIWPGKFEDLDAPISSRMPGGTQPGAAFVDHDYPTTDNLRFVNGSGQGIGGATILIYPRADYLAGSLGPSFIAGTSTTGSDGRWAFPVPLGPDDYAVVFAATGYQTAVAFITVPT